MDDCAEHTFKVCHKYLRICNTLKCHTEAKCEVHISNLVSCMLRSYSTAKSNGLFCKTEIVKHVYPKCAEDFLMSLMSKPAFSHLYLLVFIKSR